MSYSINSEPEPYNSFPLGKITKLEIDLMTYKINLKKA